MKRNFVRIGMLAAALSIVIPLAGQQQLTRDDYARAERFLLGNFNKLVFKMSVVPQFIGKTDRFWYKNETRDGVEFVLVDPVLNMRQPAFDHARLAAALSTASGKAYDSRKLPSMLSNSSRTGNRSNSASA